MEIISQLCGLLKSYHFSSAIIDFITIGIIYLDLRVEMGDTNVLGYNLACRRNTWIFHFLPCAQKAFSKGHILLAKLQNKGFEHQCCVVFHIQVPFFYSFKIYLYITVNRTIIIFLPCLALDLAPTELPSFDARKKRISHSILLSLYIMDEKGIFYLDVAKYDPQKVYSIERVEIERGIPQFIEESVSKDLLLRPNLSKKTSYYLRQINEELQNMYRPSVKSTLLAILSLLTMSISDYYIQREPITCVRIIFVSSPPFSQI